MIKVSSVGPDAKASLDDVKTMRLVMAPPGKIAGGLAKRGWEKIRQRVLGGPKDEDSDVEK